MRDIALLLILKTSVFAPLSTKKLVIAIDGPAASGKSTSARLVARALNYLYVDTGAMYRAVTLKVLRRGIDPEDELRVGEVARLARIDLKTGLEGLGVFLDEEDVTEEIRSADVTRSVSAVSRIRGVREAMVRLQRNIGSIGGVVLEGRDIGTIVFPNADLKIFMVATLDVRVRRRLDELCASGMQVQPDVLREEIKRRDELDSTRDESPLMRAADAIELDTSRLTIDEQVEFVIKKAKGFLQNKAFK